MKTIVKFLKHKDDSKAYDVFAYFPHENYNESLYGANQKQSYAQFEGHGSCSTDYAQESELASYDEYKPLLDELISQGYNDLEIINQQIETKRYENAYTIMYSKLIKEHKSSHELNTISEEWIESNKPKFM